MANSSFLGDRPFVKRFALYTIEPLCSQCVCLTVCLSCLYVTLVYCGQTVGWSKVPLGTEVGIDPGHIVLMGTQLPHGKGHSSPNFAVYGRKEACVRKPRGPCLLWPNDWIYQDTTGYRDRPRSGRHCIRWGPKPPQRKGAQQPSTFRPTLLWRGRPSQQLLSSCFPRHSVYIG